jgi:hypothetical protein
MWSFSAILSSGKKVCYRVVDAVQDLVHNRTLMIIVGAGAALLICLLIISMALPKRAGGYSKPELADSTLPRLPPEDIFVPEEPDFLPRVLLQEEPAPWTTEDIMPFWTDPLERGEGYWRERVSNALDDLLEEIP